MNGRRRVPRRLRQERWSQLGAGPASEHAPPVALLVVRAWWDAPGRLGLRARIWRGMRLPHEPVDQVLAASVDEVETVVLDWVNRLRGAVVPPRLAEVDDPADAAEPDGESDD